MLPFAQTNNRQQVLCWDKDMVALGLDEIAEGRDVLLAEFKRLMDDYHRFEKSLTYYDGIAGDWLEQFSHMVFVATAEVLASDGSLIKPSYQIPVYADTSAYQKQIVKDFAARDFLRELVAELLAGRSIVLWRFQADSVPIVSGGNKRVVLNAFRSIATSRPDVLLVDPYWKCSRTEIAATLFTWRRWVALDNLQYPIRVVASLNADWRRDQACRVGPAGNLLDVLKALLPLYIPVVFLEGFAAYHAAVLEMPVVRPKVIYSANALHGDFSFKLLVADWRSKGTRFLYHQHGGGYGIDRTLWHEEFETRVSDRFFSWGWVRSDTQKVQPLSPAAIYCPRSRPKYILLVCVDYPKSIYRLNFQPMPGSIQIMHRENYEFLDALPDHKDLLVRPYPRDYGWGYVNMLREAAPEAMFDNRRVSVHIRYAQSRLVVHGYLATGYLETLALNIPTVCFYDPSAYAFRAESQPFMNELERVGILHRSGKSAARFVTEVCKDPEGWWAKDDVQAARSRFVERYANFAPDWKGRWEREFRRAVDEC